jgi:predicted O-methyltransferase YrrM
VLAFELDRLKQGLRRRRRAPAPDWIFADDVLSAVTHPECERLARLACGRLVLELGSYYGRSTIALASTASSVHSVDPHQGGPEDSPTTLDAFLANLEAHGVRDRVIVHVGTSTNVVPTLREETFDLVFIDAMHQRPEVDIDLALAARCLRANGYVAFHDYGVPGVSVGTIWHPFGVTEAVDEFVAAARLDPPEVVDSLAVVRSPGRHYVNRQHWRAAIDALPQP